MKRFILGILMVMVTATAAARDDHVRPYSEGLAAAEAGDWATVVAKMQQAIAHESTEQKSVRIRGALVPYVPHFWMGVALAQQEKWDAAMRELSVSEKAGIVQNTSHYSQFRATKSTIESKRASAISSAGLDEARSRGDAALGKALSAQAAATRAGAARLTEFRQANQKLQEALDSRKADTVAGYRAMAESAAEATSLFDKATSKAAAQPSGVRTSPRQNSPSVKRPAAPANPAPSEAAPDEVVVSRLQVVEEEAAAQVAVPTPPSAREAEPVEATTPAVSQDSRDDRDGPGPSEPERLAAPQELEAPERSREELRRIYGAMAGGDLEGSSRSLSRILQRDPRSIPALVLRGYARYLRGTLERRDSLLTEAADDFRAALAVDPAIELDSRDFSPKAIRFFESVRNGER